MKVRTLRKRTLAMMRNRRRGPMGYWLGMDFGREPSFSIEWLRPATLADIEDRKDAELVFMRLLGTPTGAMTDAAQQLEDVAQRGVSGFEVWYDDGVSTIKTRRLEHDEFMQPRASTMAPSK